jgi:hypothetical protein
MSTTRNLGDALVAMTDKLVDLGYAESVSFDPQSIEVKWTPLGQEMRTQLARIFESIAPDKELDFVDVQALFTLFLSA